jgi:N-acetylglutamate synthase-like GNAT family acetyltransferase
MLPAQIKKTKTGFAATNQLKIKNYWVVFFVFVCNLYGIVKQMVREATLLDIAHMQNLGQLLQENIPGITINTTNTQYEDLLLGLGKAWVYQQHKNIIAFGVIDVVHNTIVGLCVHPKQQQQGIGKQMLLVMLQWYFTITKASLSLAVLKNTAASSFCSKLPFCKKQKIKANIITFEFSYAAFKTII